MIDRARLARQTLPHLLVERARRAPASIPLIPGSSMSITMSACWAWKTMSKVSGGSAARSKSAAVERPPKRLGGFEDALFPAHTA